VTVVRVSYCTSYWKLFDFILKTIMKFQYIVPFEHGKELGERSKSHFNKIVIFGSRA
jgi:hypothetical protein